MKKRESERIFDDLARVAGGAVNLLGGIRQQLRDDVRSRVEEMASRMDLVPREDFDYACTRMTEMMEDIKGLEKRISALEKGGRKGVKKSPTKTLKKAIKKKKKNP